MLKNGDVVYVEPLFIEYVYGGVPIKFLVLITIFPSQPQLGWLILYGTVIRLFDSCVVQTPE